MNRRAFQSWLCGGAAWLTPAFTLAPMVGALLAVSDARAQTAPAAPPPGAGEIVVTAQRLDAARASIQPEIGASTYTLSKSAIAAIPGGENVQLNQVILQAPGVTQDSFGQLHVRDDHNGIQFRLNGVILPEGISVFGQSISPRIIESVELITGALPAEYGLRTAGIVAITTKSGVYENGGSASIYGGSHGEVEPSFTYGGAAGGTNFFVSGSFLRTQLGVESPDGRSTPDHDRSDQLQGFAYLDRTVGDADRLSLILGTSNETFQIPNVLGLKPNLGLNVLGAVAYPSTLLSSNQRETTDYAIASWLHAADKWSTQTSVFTRYSTLTYRPSHGYGELLYNGISQSAAKQDLAFGLQAEGSLKLTDAHTLRSGLILEGDRAISDTVSAVLPVDGAGVQTSSTPKVIPGRGGHDQFEYSLYLQDEWKALPGLILNYGVRLDEVNAYVSEGQISPRFNLVWTPLKNTTVHAGYSRYFTPPPFELVGGASVAAVAGTTAATPVALDSTPKSERTDYFDVGGQQKLFGRTVTLGVDAYYRMSRNLLDEGQFGAPIILTPFNYQVAHIKGVELSAAYAKGPLSAYANFAYARAMAKDIVSSQFNFDPGDLAYIRSHYIFLDHDQTYTGSAGVAYEEKNGVFAKTKVSADLIYGSGLRANLVLPDGASIPNGRAIPNYVQVNASLSHRFSTPFGRGLEARLDVINLFDKRYEIRDGTGVGVGAPQFGARRGLFAGVTELF